MTVAGIGRSEIEDFNVYLAGRRGMQGGPLAENTVRQRLRMLRVFFERIIEWDWTDAPARNPILNWDLPRRPEPLPKFLDDHDAAKFMAAARASRDPRSRLVVELLARTGMRSGELLALDADAVVRIGQGTGCGSRWASCATTATSRCTRSWSGYWPSGPQPTSNTSAPTAC